MSLIDTFRILRARPGAIRRTDLASQWQLMWWRFRKHRMAMVGMVLLGILGLCVVFPGPISPYAPGERNAKYVAGAPMMPHFFESDGTFHLRPFVYGVKSDRDPVTLKLRYSKDESKIWEIEFFVRGDAYSLFGIPLDVHLFGTPEGFIHLFGTDFTGLDIFSRTIYACRVSLSVGFVGVLVSFVLGAAIGGAAGYFGGQFDNIVMRVI
ncbi:MAG TPA: ABC transporter permease, partial [Alphaproteobacteria bacterium]|nr:ABC transporter permease [Alphaproteobacteria bacterium]